MELNLCLYRKVIKNSDGFYLSKNILVRLLFVSGLREHNRCEKSFHVDYGKFGSATVVLVLHAYKLGFHGHWTV